jgi:predicted dehydrogenase
VLAFGRVDVPVEGGTAMRFGLFGTGPWAHLAHAPGLAAHQGVEFVGVWGRNQDKAAALAGEYGATAYPTVDALIADVDAVAVALPPDVQAPIALSAARAGKHLLLDKPVAFTVAEADEIADAAAQGSVASAVFFTRRYMPQVQDFLAQTARTGGWVEARVDHVGSIYEPGNPFGESPWRRESGGLWDVGPHAVALVLPVLGPVTEVTALVGPRDMSHLLLRHGSGAISTLTLSVDAPPAAAREEAVFAGEAGVVAVPDLPWEPVLAFGRMLDELLAAADGGPQPELDVRFGAGVTAVLVAAEEAARSGRTVRLPA